MPFVPIAFALALTCNAGARAAALPPAMLPPSLAARYPNGVETNLVIAVDASGKVRSATGDWNDALGAAIVAWAKKIAFAPAQKNCKPVASTVEMDDVDFFAPSSGIVGSSNVVDGVDFANLTYVNGPGNCKTAHMRDGRDADPSGEYDAEIQDVFAGRLAGRRVAVVILRCEYNGHGFDSQAQLFAIDSGKARRLGILGDGGMASSDSPLPPWPGGWIHISFADDKLYADVWDSDRRCDPHRDWVSSTYAIRDGILTVLSTLAHHRAGLPVTCGS